MKKLSNKKLILLVLLGILLVLILNYAFTYFHELGHQQAFKKYGIESNITLTLPKSTSMFTMGKALFSREDCKKINQLELSEKTEILLAGIKADVLFALVLIFLGMIFLLISLFYVNKKDSRKFYIFFILGIFLLLLAFARLVNIPTNLSYKHGTDVFWISNNLIC